MWIVWTLLFVLAAPFLFFGFVWLVAIVGHERRKDAARWTFAARDWPPVD